MKKTFIVLWILCFCSISSAFAYDATFRIISKVDCELTIDWWAYYGYTQGLWYSIGETNCYDQELTGRITDFNEGQTATIDFKATGCGKEKVFPLTLMAEKETEYIINSSNFNASDCFSDPPPVLSDLPNLNGTLWLKMENEDRHSIMGFYNDQYYQAVGLGLGSGDNYRKIKDGYFYTSFLPIVLGLTIEIGKYSCAENCTMNVMGFSSFFLLPVFYKNKYILINEAWVPPPAN